MISGEVLSELWKRCPPDIREQVEATAKLRIGKKTDEDVTMVDVDNSTPSIRHLEIADRPPTPSRQILPQVTFTPSKPASPHKPSRAEDSKVIEPRDPDPFLSVDMDNMRSRAGRRSSWAPPPPDSSIQPTESPPGPYTRSRGGTPVDSKPVHVTTPPDSCIRPKRARTLQRRPSQFSKGLLPDGVLVKIFSYLDIYHIMRIRCVSQHWSRLLNSSPEILRHLDLSAYNKNVTNKALVDYICPFVGNRPWTIDISNCFHITDEGFNALTSQCSQNVKTWKMKSVWDITANAVLEMANSSKELEEIDLSNCRKVSDNLLARIVGWVVTDPHAPVKLGAGRYTYGQQQGLVVPPVGTVVGCPKLKKLTLSYCKHVTDRSMAHLAVHAHARLQSMDLTRCTTITDAGFQHWSIYKFANLERLILADCTYLTDNAIVYLTNAAKGLKELDLVCYTTA
jgi:F-box/leucine-rich repeat protein 7